MYLSDLKPPRGAHKKPKRVGRGEASGMGKTCGRGHKGQKSRKSGHTRPGFEGGQMPMHRRLPKRGFKNIFRVELAEVNVSSLAKRFEADSVVDIAAMIEKGLVGRRARGVKILGYGDLPHALTVKATKFSASAKEKIEKSGGAVEIVG